MGLTIHYDLEFKGKKDQAEAKIKEVKNIAMSLPFQEVSRIWKVDYSLDYDNEAENKAQAPEDPEAYRWAKIQYQPKSIIEKTTQGWSIHRPPDDSTQYRGFVVMCWAGEGCESTNIGLISKDGLNWQGGAFTKTQYAKHFVKAHLLVITILDVCKKIGILKSVSDEGDYWETRDLKKLASNINESTEFIRQVGKTLTQIFPTDQIVSAIDKNKNYLKVNDGTDRKRCRGKNQTSRDNRGVR